MVSFDKVRRKLIKVRPDKWGVYGNNLEIYSDGFRFSLYKVVDQNSGHAVITDYRLEVYEGDDLTPLVSFGRRGDDRYVETFYNQIRQKVESSEEGRKRSFIHKLERALGKS